MGYCNLCKLIIVGVFVYFKGEVCVDVVMFVEYVEGLYCFVGSDEGVLVCVLVGGDVKFVWCCFDCIVEIFIFVDFLRLYFYVELQCYGLCVEEYCNCMLIVFV